MLPTGNLDHDALAAFVVCDQQVGAPREVVFVFGADRKLELTLQDLPECRQSGGAVLRLVDPSVNRQVPGTIRRVLPPGGAKKYDGFVCFDVGGHDIRFRCRATASGSEERRNKNDAETGASHVLHWSCSICGAG